uniref:NADH-ubiquinone oxidoreductase chain 2 n=1 Tax=Phyllocnistis citrella TaxID=199020 RepID=A0A7M1LDE6_9NEOP|nr:NADH dehydrogenase subunit 2 [Phyllocnistis citrella]QOQ85851.1 NADH dehydrogenase subunit 2 [Phyllocnistis citrella]
MMKYFNLNKIFFFFILIFSTLISISSNSWLGCWIGLEINLLSFIPLITNCNNMSSSEASLKYFLIQTIASINFIFFILLNIYFMNFFKYNDFITILMNSSMLMKMGSFPFHFWYPNIIEGLSWMNCFILMTWQKITPMILLSYYFNFNFLIFILIFNSIIGAIGGINQTSLRKILVYSSINNLSWMMMSILISENLWILYFVIYSMLILFLCFMFNFFKINFFNQLFSMNMNNIMKMSLLFNFLSLGGLPPFLGFLPKWMMINFFLEKNFYFLTFIFIMMSLVLLFFYIRIMFTMFLFNNFKIKWFKINLNLKINNMMMFFSMISFLGLPLSTFYLF